MTSSDRTSSDRTSMRWTDQQADGAGGGTDDWQERLALRNWTLPVKLAAVLLVPTVFVVSLGVLRIVEQTEKARSYDGVQQAVALEDRTSTLLADLAAERTAAAVYVASGREGGPAIVRERADASESSADEMRDAANSADSLDQQARTAYNDAANGLQQLYRLRTEVQLGQVDAAGVVARYSEEINALLAFDRSLTREAADPSVAGLAGGLYALSVVREEDAYVQAVVAAAIAAGRIDAPSIDQARNATLRRTIAVDDFRAAIGTVDSQLSDAVVGRDVDARDRLAQVVLGRGSAGLPLQVSGPEWERASAVVTERVADTSEQLRGRLQTNAQALQDGARNAAGIASVVLLLALIAGAAVVFFVTRSLLRPLRLLRRTALDVAERRLPGAVRSLREGEAPDTDVAPTPIRTREEIGQVARAFDQVHEQAVRLAAEQAGLRAAFNSIFVNLSRRSQALVERQLRLIEQLENNEEDPESLSNLFQLDHLATRMRRNSENLLVLSGTDLSRRGTRPVPVVDVLRAAASEVEQYQRVDLQPPPNVMLLGRTASDVVHLVAELLENATTFSAPDTRVDVIVTQGADGGLAVDIADTGVGMNAVDMADANQRLASPPTVDVSASRRMGLFVVGRLAIRHGISVVLRDRDPAGVVAAVVVPANAILAAQPGGPRAMEPPVGARGATGPAGAAPAGAMAMGAGAMGAGAMGATAIGAAAGAGAAVPAGTSSSEAQASGTLPRQDRNTARPGPPTDDGGTGGADAGGRRGAPTSFFEDTSGGTEGDLPRRGPRGVLGALPTRNGRRFPPPGNGPGANGAGVNGAGANGAGANGAGANGAGANGAGANGTGADGTGADGTGVGDTGTRGSDETGTAEPGGDGPGREPDRDRPRRAGGSLAPVHEVPPPGGEEVDDTGEVDQADDRVASVNPTAAADEGVTVWRAPGAEGDVRDDEHDSITGDGDADGRGADDGPPGRHGWRGPPPTGSPAMPPAGRPQHRLPSPPDHQPPGPRSTTGPGAYPPGRPPPPGPARGWPQGGAPPPAPRPDPTTPGQRSDAATPERPAAGPGPGSSTTPGPSRELSGPPVAAEGAESTPDEARASRRARAMPMTVRRGAVPRGADEPTVDGADGPATSAEPARTDAADAPPQDGGSPDRAAPGGARVDEGVGTERAPRPLGRRRGPTATPIPASGSTPRMRPRRSEGAGEPAAGSSPPSERAGSEEGLFAPAEGGEQGDGAAGSPSPRRASGPPDGAGVPNGAGATNGVGAPRAMPPPRTTTPPRAAPERLPLRTGTAGRERTPIFDEVASVWFREGTPGDQQAEEWTTSGDAGWRAAAASTEAADGGTTEAGLPRRRPRARLVPGAAEASSGTPDPAGPGPRAVAPGARPAPPNGTNGATPTAPAESPRRNAASVRGRLASYQRGVNEGRSSRRGPTENTDAGAPRPGDEEEQ